MAQRQYIKYYEAYVDATRKPSTGKPPKSLLSMTDPEGDEAQWLKETFARAKGSDGHIVSGNVVVTTGPELSSKGPNRSRIKFQACNDARKVKVMSGSKTRRSSWELLNVEMRATTGATHEQRGSSPSAWRVYRTDQVNEGKSCEF